MSGIQGVFRQKHEIITKKFGNDIWGYNTQRHGRQKKRSKEIQVGRFTE
jgi:ribosomal protein S17E